MRFTRIAPWACLAGLLARPAMAQEAAPDDSSIVPEGGIPPRSIAWPRWTLFDPYLSPREFGGTGGYVSEKEVGAKTARPGIEATFGQTIESRAGALFARLQLEWGVRSTEDGHVVLAVPRYTYAGGTLVGPLEVSARVGAAFVEVHFGSGGFGVGLLSPRVGVAVAVRAGSLRLGVAAFSEYAWRWFGGPNARVASILFEVSLVDLSHPLPPWRRIER